MVFEDAVQVTFRGLGSRAALVLQNKTPEKAAGFFVSRLVAQIGLCKK